MTIPAKQTLVLGLGNPLRGDDGLGPAVIQWMQRHGLPPGVTAIDGGTPGLDVILTLADYRRVYIVDAADLGRAPGEWARIAPDLQRLTAEAGVLSSHSAGLADALALGAALAPARGKRGPGVLPEQTIIFGIQPAGLEWSPGLSAEARRAVPEVGRAILNELEVPPLDLAELQTSEISRGASEVSREDHARSSCQSAGVLGVTMAKILIVDDDPDIVLATRLSLQGAGHQVFDAKNGREGLRLVEEIKPDLIILDVMMDTTTEGFQVSLKLRSPDPGSPLAAYRHIPILMLTALHSTTDLRFGPDEDYLPVDAFVDKPIDPDKLVRQVNALLAKARHPALREARE